MNSKISICSYCQTEQEQKKVCSFCGADLNKTRPKIRQTLSEDEAYRPQPILETYHTLDLMILLRFLREQRTDNYKLMQTVRKAPEAAQIPTDTIAFAEKQYREHTSRAKVIEQILIDRLGYKPKRIDDKLLNALEFKIKNA